MSDTHTLARRDGRSTSFEAAAKQTRGKRAELYTEIMYQLQYAGPMTDPEIIATLQTTGFTCTPSGVRSRRNELVAAGWVTEERDEHGAVVKKLNGYGSPCTVWRAVREDEDHEPPKPTRRRTSGPLLGDESTAEHMAGLAAARRWAAWNLGLSALADNLLQAYLHPQETESQLDEEGAP